MLGGGLPVRAHPERAFPGWNAFPLWGPELLILPTGPFSISVKAARPYLTFTASRPTVTTTYSRPQLSIEEN